MQVVAVSAAGADRGAGGRGEVDAHVEPSELAHGVASGSSSGSNIANNGGSWRRRPWRGRGSCRAMGVGSWRGLGIFGGIEHREQGGLGDLGARRAEPE